MKSNFHEHVVHRFTAHPSLWQFWDGSSGFLPILWPLYGLLNVPQIFKGELKPQNKLIAFSRKTSEKHDFKNFWPVRSILGKYQFEVAIFPLFRLLNCGRQLPVSGFEQSPSVKAVMYAMGKTEK